MKEFTSTGSQTTASVLNLQVQHRTDLHVTVVAMNSAGLSSVVCSDHIPVDLTPPVLVLFLVHFYYLTIEIKMF